MIPGAEKVTPEGPSGPLGNNWAGDMTWSSGLSEGVWRPCNGWFMRSFTYFIHSAPVSLTYYVCVS